MSEVLAELDWDQIDANLSRKAYESFFRRASVDPYKPFRFRHYKNFEEIFVGEIVSEKGKSTTISTRYLRLVTLKTVEDFL